MTITPLYSPLTDKALWVGRADALENEYVFQTIQYLDLNSPLTPLTGFALLGFECDTGVSRNQGNPGAVDGPCAFRRTFAKLPLQTPHTLYDAGNVTCIAGDLEAAQRALGVQVNNILSRNLTPIIIGGGHETAWGHFQGLAQHYLNNDIAILNFDAHFDLRPLINGHLGSSGTPFRQINNLLIAQQRPFNYYCAGIQPFSNTQQLFNYAQANKVNYLLAETINANPYDLGFIKNIINTHQSIYVSICMDVFSAALAPGVSAPQPLGIHATYVLEALKLLKQSGKVISLDIVELAPKYDINAQTAKLSSALLMTYMA